MALFDLPVGKSDEGNKLRFEDYPELECRIKSVRESLCPSAYSSSVKCFWEGDLEIVLEIGLPPVVVTINDHDERRGKSTNLIVGDFEYLFQGLGPVIIDRDPGQTYLRTLVDRKPIPRRLRIGEIFSIELPENPSTGYHWDFQFTPGLELIDNRFELSERCGRNPPPGCGGVRLIKLRALAVGPQSVEATLKPPGRGRENEWETTTYRYSVRR